MSNKGLMSTSECAIKEMWPVFPAHPFVLTLRRRGTLTFEFASTVPANP